MKNESANRINFYKFLSGELSLPEFEKWIYENKELESEIGGEVYTELISFNFSSHDTIPFIKKIVLSCFDWKEYEEWRTINLLTGILENKIEIVLATRKMRQLYLEQLDTMTKPHISSGLAIGYESELDSCPLESEYHLYNKLKLKTLLEPVNWYKKPILEQVSQELEELTNPEVKTINLEHVVNIDHFHEIFMEKFNFPDYYGKNWDAFWDTITGIVELPKILKLKNWKKFKKQKQFKNDSKILEKIISDYNKEFSNKEIIIYNSW